MHRVEGDLADQGTICQDHWDLVQTLSGPGAGSQWEIQVQFPVTPWSLNTTRCGPKTNTEKLITFRWGPAEPSQWPALMMLCHLAFLLKVQTLPDDPKGL